MTVVLQEDRCPGCGKFVRRGAACGRCLVLVPIGGGQMAFADGDPPYVRPRSVLTHTYPYVRVST